MTRCLHVMNGKGPFDWNQNLLCEKMKLDENKLNENIFGWRLNEKDQIVERWKKNEKDSWWFFSPLVDNWVLSLLLKLNVILIHLYGWIVSTMGFKLLKFKSKDEREGILKKKSMIWNNNIHPIKTKSYPLIFPWNRKNLKVKTYLCCRCTKLEFKCFFSILLVINNEHKHLNIIIYY